MIPEFCVILPAAGKSTRFQGFGKKKPFVELNGVPIWKRTVDVFKARSDVGEIVLVLSDEDIDEFRKIFAGHLDGILTVAGGESRANSVRNGLQASNSELEFVAVHDAARPLIRPFVIDGVFESARQVGAAIPGIPVTSTVKRVDSEQKITGTVERSPLRLAQTPQCFSRKILESSIGAAGAQLESFTDEASIVEANGHEVRITPGAWDNIKITTPDDFELARLILNGDSTEGSRKPQ